MRFVGIKRKSDGEIVATANFGETILLPGGLKASDIEVVSIVVPEYGDDDSLAKNEQIVQLEKVANHFGITLASFIETTAKAFGIPPCSRCELRKLILYTMDKLGKIRAFRLIWKTIRNKPFTKEEKLMLENIWKKTL